MQAPQERETKIDNKVMREQFYYLSVFKRIVIRHFLVSK